MNLIKQIYYFVIVFVIPIILLILKERIENMNIKKFFKLLITNPNSPKGLIIRAEYLEERAEKIDSINRRSLLLYARILRELASKNYSAEYNKDWTERI